MAPARTKRLATIFSVILIIPPRARTSKQRPAPAIAAAQLYILQGGQFGLCKMIARKILDAVFRQLRPVSKTEVAENVTFGESQTGMRIKPDNSSEN